MTSKTLNNPENREGFTAVKKYYNTHVAEEDQRLKDNVFELPVTFLFLDRYLKRGDKVLDMACGTGRYAAELIDRDIFVGLNDLSDRNLDLALKRLGNHQNILHHEASNALHSGLWDKETWDAILLLGPLYHMTDRTYRLEILRRARQAVRPGGTIFTAFMSRTAALQYGLKNNPGGILRERGANQLWETGTDDEFVEGTPWFVNTHFVFPEEIDPLIREAWLDPIHLAGIEGIFGEHMEGFTRLEPELRRAWMDFIIDHCEDPRMVGASKHILSVSQAGNPTRTGVHARRGV